MTCECHTSSRTTCECRSRLHLGRVLTATFQNTGRNHIFPHSTLFHKNYFSLYSVFSFLSVGQLINVQKTIHCFLWLINHDRRAPPPGSSKLLLVPVYIPREALSPDANAVYFAISARLRAGITGILPVYLLRYRVHRIGFRRDPSSHIHSS